ncbi:DUF397 domain-containing protein [Actinomadura hibisca]|uniref:DUF397 domain-containing protein n=1 Tax=Actinomadura hibisca TaxID=68565 RepID=UPI0024809627|nr:DUF397 domain-containing protein [Actinomadura hibisca]
MTDDTCRLVWRKSSRSTQQGDCVELAAMRSEIAIRDSKDPEGPRLVFAKEAMGMLAKRVKSGGLDL